MGSSQPLTRLSRTRLCSGVKHVTMFFQVSRLAFKQVGETFDFIWPTAVAMWHMRSEVAKFLSDNPGVRLDALDDHYAAGSGLRTAWMKGRVATAFKDRSWANQQDGIAKLLLINLCAIYEYWCQQIIEELAPPNSVKQEFIKDLQYQTRVERNRTTGKKQHRGICTAIDSLSTPESRFIRTDIYPCLVKHRYYRFDQLDLMLTCFRFFKECRNSVAHTGGYWTSKESAAYSEFAKALPQLSIQLCRMGDYPAGSLGSPITLTLGGIVGLSELILRMIVTADAELARSAKAEEVFVRQWKDMYPDKVILKGTGKNADRRRGQIRTRLLQAGWPAPQNADATDEFLRANQLVF